MLWPIRRVKSLTSDLSNRILELPRAIKLLVAMILDAALAILSVLAAYYIRLDAIPQLSHGMLFTTGFAILTSLAALHFVGIYRSISRHSGWAAIGTVLNAALLSSLPMVAVVTMIGLPGVPRTVGITQPIIMLLLVIASRGLVRGWLGGGFRQMLNLRQQGGVVIYGAGSAGRQLSSALMNGSSPMRVIAYLDDDASLSGRRLNGIPVEPPQRLPHMVETGQVTDVLLALPSVSRRRRNEIISDLRRLPVHVQTLPGLTDLARGRVSLTDLRELDIEDLLGRDPVEPNHILLGKNTVGKTVLITGAGGSIGSELCRQVLLSGPITLLLVETSEFALYTINQNLLSFELPVGVARAAIIPLLASVRDEGRMTEILATWRPSTVYHAAAYKHVPLVEHNIVEGIRNNVHGTLVTAQACQKNGVADFVLVSTDKAVRPSNVMGASKRLAEMALQALSERSKTTRFSIVRFGNVLGSSGSVVPLFRRQIAEGGPVTITHPDITRYFMTIPEAAQLVISAGAMAHGGEVFVLDMGQPVRIVDLARRMIALSGLSVRGTENPDGDIEISVIGVRPGEKLYEELLIGDNPVSTRHPRIMRANEEFWPWSVFQTALSEIDGALDRRDWALCRRLLQTHVPGYLPEGEMVDWIQMERAAG
jgi:FlaA1/EpsC-like NDP-sugar epimerase